MDPTEPQAPDASAEATGQPVADDRLARLAADLVRFQSEKAALATLDLDIPTMSADPDLIRGLGITAKRWEQERAAERKEKSSAYEALGLESVDHDGPFPLRGFPPRSWWRPRREPLRDFETMEPNVSNPAWLQEVSLRSAEESAARMLESLRLRVGGKYAKAVQRACRLWARVFNLQSCHWGVCENCLVTFYKPRPNRQFCEKGCGSAKRNRGLQRVGSNRQSPAENARRRAELATTKQIAKLVKRMKAHAKTCGACTAKRFCMEYQEMFEAAEIRRIKLAPEVAESMGITLDPVTGAEIDRSPADGPTAEDAEERMGSEWIRGQALAALPKPTPSPGFRVRKKA